MKRCLVYCFYEKYGIAEDYVFYFFDKIQYFFKDIFIVVNGVLDKNSEEKFKKYTDKIINRENYGFDAGAYKHLIDLYSVEYFRQYDEVIFANNTFYGPLYDLKNLFEKMEDDDNDFWGITRHPSTNAQVAGVEICEHLQSYFIAFKKSILLSQDFNDYWNNLKIPSNYDDAVVFFELYTTQFFVQRGYIAGAYTDINPCPLRVGRPYFYDVYKWVDKYKLPFIKKKIFEFENFRLKNPIKKGVVEFLKLIADKTSYDVNLIYLDLQKRYSYQIEHYSRLRVLFRFLYIMIKKSVFSCKQIHYCKQLKFLKDTYKFMSLLKKKKRKRILLISHDLSLTGAPLVLFNMSKYLIELGFSVDVITYNGGNSYELFDKYAEIGIVPVFIDNDEEKIKVFCTKNAGNYDLIICNTVVTYKFAEIARRLNARVVWYVHEAELLNAYMYRYPDFAKIFSEFDKIYTVSKYASKVAKRYNRKIKILPNGIEDVFEQFYCNKDSLTFGYIGSIAKVKGVDVLVDSYMELSKKYTNTKLIIAGIAYDSFMDELVQKTEKYSNICWIGNVDGESKKEFFNKIDVLCVPSRDDSCPLTVFEGCMYGKPVITTKKTGSNYIVKNKQNGFILPSLNSNSLYKALEYFCLNPDKTVGMQQKSRSIFLKSNLLYKHKKAVKQMLEDNIRP